MANLSLFKGEAECCKGYLRVSVLKIPQISIFMSSDIFLAIQNKTSPKSSQIELKTDQRDYFLILD